MNVYDQQLFVSQRLREAKERCGKSYRQLSRETMISVNTIASAIRNDGQNPRADTLAALCRAMGVSADWVLGLGGEDGGKSRYEPPNPPLTLDELQEMDGEPVWVAEGKAKYYALITDIFPKAIWVTSRTDSDAEMPVDEYGKTWLAYRRRPGEEQK